MDDRAAGRLSALLVPDPPSFALLYRPETGRDIEVLLGEVTEVGAIRDLQVPPPIGDEEGHDLLVVVPYRQIIERGYACVDDEAPLLQMTVRAQETISVAAALRELPDEPVTLRDAGFDTDDESYEEIVRTVLAEEIGKGAGANFVIKRTFRAIIADFSARRALTIFKRLLTTELGAYWTFVVYTGTQTFIGASPERHVSLDQGTVVMNPISGTYRYPPIGTTTPGVLGFLADQKETDELYMVLDEELKMMAAICGSGGQVLGPRLKEMAWLAHTEYLIQGQNQLDVRDILRETMFAPTVTGSPLENACRVIAHYEPGGRGYYSGALALIGHDRAGNQTLDSTIIIRTGEIDRRGRMRLGVGATLVRHSDPASEAAETRAKLAGMLSALDGGEIAPRWANLNSKIGNSLSIKQALGRKNERLARFWLEDPGDRDHRVWELEGRSVLVIDAEDTFTAMLGHQLSSLGLTVTIRRFDRPLDSDDHDFVVIGPGPGDPRTHADQKIAILRDIAQYLLDNRRRFLAVCLGHQVLSGLLGLDIVRKPVPNQGKQTTIDLFGERKTVGFYNTFVVRCQRDSFYCPNVPGPVDVIRDISSNEVHALCGPNFRSIQFHPESVLSIDGLTILADLLKALAPTCIQPGAR